MPSTLLAADLHPGPTPLWTPTTERHRSIARLVVRRAWKGPVNEYDEELELERGESRMTADARRDVEAETDVRLTGLIPRLTSPSRNNGDLVDIWFGVERRHRTYEWDETFIRIAKDWRPDPRRPSHFALFSHPSSSALIVARQVSPDRAVWREIETEARALVNRVNRAVAEQRTPPRETPRGAGRLRRDRSGPGEAARPRTWLSEAAQAIRNLVPKPAIISESSSTGVR